MTRQILLGALPLAALFASVPASALTDSEGRAIAACRADMLSRFEPGQVRSYRVGEIAGTSRSTRVTLYVNADRRYTFACAADGQGQVVTASIDPARGAGRQLAAGAR
ncbi:MAG: hypothetical protein JO276_14660 [Sphingomonadaceae bacterium]|nr:hypothetical protein [Sphingomonadaceae bacterium]